MKHNENSGHIKVSGTATLKLPPEILTLKASVEEVAMIPAEAIQALQKDMTALRSCIESSGPAEMQVNTGQISVDEVTETDEKGRRYKSGHEASSSISVKVPFTSEVLPQLLKAVAKSQTKPSLSVCYSLTDEKTATIRLLSSATLDAKSKADAIAETLQQEVLFLVEATVTPTQRHWMERDQPIRLGLQNLGGYGDDGDSAESYSDSPKDIEISRTVECVFAISGPTH